MSIESPWLPELQAILRGIAHGVSNRVAALAALVELGDAETAEGRADILEELRRLQQLNVQLKQLVAEPRPEAEALSLAEVCSQAAALHSLRLDQRDVPCRVEGTGDAAVRADRSSLLRDLLVLLAQAARENPSAIQVRIEGDDVEARVRINDHVLALPSLQEVRRRERDG